MTLAKEKEDFIYTLVSINTNEGNKMSSGHYSCDIFDSNTVTWWHCDCENITKLRALPDNV